MNTVWIVLIAVLVALLAAMIVIYFLGKRAQKRQEEQQAQIEAAKQSVTMLVIDKKRLPLKQAGLPQVVIDATPKMMRRAKLPIVKAKVGPRIMTLVADERIYEQIPVKKEVKAMVSGIYIVEVKGIRGSLEQAPPPKGFIAKLRAKALNSSR